MKNPTDVGRWFVKFSGNSSDTRVCYVPDSNTIICCGDRVGKGYLN